MLQKFGECLDAKNTPPTTRRAYMSDMRSMVNFANDEVVRTGHSPAGKVTAAKWLKKMTDEGSSTATIARRKAAYNNFADCFGFEKITKNDFRIPPQEPPKPRPLPNGMADVDAMINHAKDIGNGRAAVLVTLMGKVGLRVSEAIAVMPCDIHNDGTISVAGKGSKKRILPLSEQVYEYLDGWAASYHDGESIVGMANSTARARITQIGEDLDMEVASHDLRATFATDLYRRTKDIVVVQRFLGHADVKTTQRYIGIDLDEMRAAL